MWFYKTKKLRPQMIGMVLFHSLLLFLKKRFDEYLFLQKLKNLHPSDFWVFDFHLGLREEKTKKLQLIFSMRSRGKSS